MGIIWMYRSEMQSILHLCDVTLTPAFDVDYYQETLNVSDNKSKNATDFNSQYRFGEILVVV